MLMYCHLGIIRISVDTKGDTYAKHGVAEQNGTKAFGGVTQRD